VHKPSPLTRRTAGHKVWPDSVAAAHAHYNSRCLPPLQLDHNFLFGFAYFRQVRDPSIRRGYYQKSVILLSYLPLVSFFTQIATLVANKFFENGDLPLEIFCHDVERWPSLNPGTMMLKKFKPKEHFLINKKICGTLYHCHCLSLNINIKSSACNSAK
jgi:hypothetical protein